MNDAASVLIRRVRQSGIYLLVRGKDLIVDAPKGELTTELCEALKAHKSDVVAELKAKGEDIQEVYEERAAIMEFEGKLSRTEAEKAAARTAWHYACENGIAAGTFISSLGDCEAVKAVLEETHGARVTHLQCVTGRRLYQRYRLDLMSTGEGGRTDDSHRGT